MKKLISLAALFAAAAVVCSGQGIALPPYPAQKVVNGQTVYVAPIPKATVTICNTTTVPQDGAICSPLATIYDSITLNPSSQIQNPTNADANGNIGNVYMAAGNYVVTISGNGVTSHSYLFQATSGAISSIFGRTGAVTAQSGDYSCAQVTGCGGGSANPASPANAIQLANGAVNALATATNATGNSLGVDNVSIPTQLNVPFSEAVTGPRPYIDVTAPPYNADPSGASDSTSAIQAAITAACSAGINNPNFSGVMFPPGRFKVTQVQTGVSSNGPIFVGCRGLSLFSPTGSVITTSQGANAPTSATIIVTAGASPNNGPVFQFCNAGTLCAGGSSANTGVNSFVSGLALQCYNQCISAFDSVQLRLENDDFSTQVTGQTDNTPVKITNLLILIENNDVFNSGSGSVPTQIWSGEPAIDGEGQYVSPAYLNNISLFGGGISYIQRVSAPTLTGNWNVINSVGEDSIGESFIAVSESSPGLINGVLGVSFTAVQESDFSGTVALYSMNVSTGYTQDLEFHNSPQQGGAVLACIQGGTLRSFTSASSGFIGNCSTGVSVGSGTVRDSSFSINHISPAANFNDIPAFPSAAMNPPAAPGISDRWFSAGGTGLAKLGIDASLGYLFGDGATHGFTGAWQQNVTGAIDMEVQATPPPTSLAGTATTGGSLAAGTYYAILWTNNTGTSPTLCGPDAGASKLSPFAYSAGVVVGGSNNAVNWTWTAPAASPVSPVAYCMQITNAPPDAGRFDARAFAALFFNAPASSFLYTGQAQSNLGTVYSLGVLQAMHRFTYNSLSINTLSNGGFNFNVNGTANISGGITLGNVASGTQCLHANSSGLVTGTGSDCGSGGGSSIFQSYQFGSQTPITGANNYLQLTFPAIFTQTQTGSGTSGSPFVDALGLNTQNANFVWAGPISGGAAAPVFRALVSADIPNNAANTSGTAATASAWATPRNLAGNSVDGSANVNFTNKVIEQGTSDAGFPNAQFLGALSTGLLKVTTTTGVLSNGAASDVIGLFTGTPSTTTFLRGDGSWQVPAGSGPGSGNQFGIAYWSTTSALGSNTPPTGNGQYTCGYTVTGGVALAPTCPQVGLALRAVTGTTSTDTILYTDNSSNVDYQGSVAVAVALPTPTTLGNPSFVTRLINNTSGSATALTLTATTLTFQSTSSTTLTIAQGQSCLLAVDPSTTVWDDTCSDLPFVAGSNITITRGQFGPTIASSNPGGTVTSIATTAPIGGGTITSTGTITCTTCVVATSPGAGVAHFAGSTQTATSSAVTSADATGNTSGSGNFCLVTSCVMTTPNLGIPSALDLLHATDLPCGAMPALTGAVTTTAASCATTIAANAVTGAKMANNTVTATQLAAQYSKGQCTEVWGGTGASNALQSGDDAIANNTCYNDSGVTRTITAVKCRADVASNTTTVNPTFGSAGTGTTILSGALTCGSSYAYSSTGTVTNASWTTGSGIDPGMGGTLTGDSIAVLIEYTF